MSSIFLTAYDPSDLPGGSVDPLGFERGYLHLAEKILPGLTNAAVCPRYLGMLCTGVYLAGEFPGLPEQKQRAARQEAVRRLERLWAVANYLANQEANDLLIHSLRGSSYVVSHVEALKRKGVAKTSCDFLMLSRQNTYGALGIYGGVAVRTKLMFASTMELVPSMGDELSLAFRRETELPSGVKAAVSDLKREVGFEELANWGRRSYLWGKTGDREREFLKRALTTDAVRERFARLLEQHPAQEDEPEQVRLRRISKQIRGVKDHADLWEAIEAILGFEECYRFAQLALERIIFLAKRASEGFVTVRALGGDEIMKRVVAGLPEAHGRWRRHLDGCGSAHTKDVPAALDDVLVFLGAAAHAAEAGVSSLVESVMARHTDVQQGKFDRGRRKMPWLEIRDGRISLTLTRVGGLTAEATSTEDIDPHPYRLTAADNWIRATGGMR